MNTIDVFEQAKLKRQERKRIEEEKAVNNGIPFTFEKINFFGLKDNVGIPLRMIGNPVDMRTEPWHPKVVFQSKVLCDNGKKMALINWDYTFDSNGEPKLNEEWLLTRLYRDITEGEWRRYANNKEVDGKKGEWFYYHKETPMFARVKEGNKLPQWKSAPFFNPLRRVVFNAIDRFNYAWHIKSKKYKLIASRHEVYQEKDPVTGTPARYNTDFGIPYNAYETIFDATSGRRGNWTDYDLIVTKLPTSNNYSVVNMFDEQIPSELKQVCVDTPLTVEELSWEKHDLDKLYQVTSYTKILRVLGKLFKAWDQYKGTQFYQELLECVKIEKEERAKDKNRLENKTHTGMNFQITPQTQKGENPFDDSAIPENMTAAHPFDSYESFPYWNELTDDEKYEMKQVTIGWTEGVPQFDPDNKSLIRCENPNCFFPQSTVPTQTPSRLKKCPVCGMNFSVF